MKTQITPKIMIKVWNLHNSSVKPGLIAETLGISSNSVNRVIQFMTLASKGENIDEIGGKNHAKQKAFAKAYFGIENPAPKPVENPAPKPVETTEATTEKTPIANNELFQEFAINVLFALSQQNKMLEKLLDSLGIEL